MKSSASPSRAPTASMPSATESSWMRTLWLALSSELLTTLLLGTSVNKGKRKDRSCYIPVLLEQRPEDGGWKLVHRHEDPISTPQLASCPYPISGQDDFRAQFVALVGKPGFVVNAKAAVWEWQDIEVADVHGLAVGMSQPSGFSVLVCEACAFEPVLFSGGSAVVQHGGDASAAGVPGPRTSFQRDAVPFPAETVFARGVGRIHAILLAGLVEEVAADPGPPSLARTLHQWIFDAGEAVAWEDGASVGRSEPFRLVGFECVDPPVGAIRVGAADVKTPAPRLGTDERRAFHALRAELGLLEGSDGGEPLSVL